LFKKTQQDTRGSVKSSKEREIVSALNLIAFLKRKGRVSLEVLSKHFHIEREELLEILESLKDISVPPYGGGDYLQVIFDHEGQVQLQFAEHFQGPVKLSLEEITALRLWMVALGGDEAWKGVVGALLEKLEEEAVEAPGFSMDIRRLKQAEGQSRILDSIDRSLKEQRILSLEYFSFRRDSLEQLNLKPLGLLDRKGQWILIADDPSDNSRKSYRVDRIRRAWLEQESFFRVDVLDFSPYFESPFEDHLDYPTVTLSVGAPLKEEVKVLARAWKEEAGQMKAEIPVASLSWLMHWMFLHADHLDLVDAGMNRQALKKHVEKLKQSFS
jgi:predicted DNA-binding transcriptional regulator YafY